LEAKVSRTVEVPDEVFAFLRQLIREIAGLEVAGDGAPAIEPVETAAPSAGSRIVEVTIPDTERAYPGLILREVAYELPVLDVVDELGGSAPSRKVIDLVGAYLDSKGLLTEMDKKRLKSGEIRWRARAAFARKHLAERGDLDGNAPRGVWTITEQGRQRVREWRDAGRPL
jgi:hypothetical protein